MNCFRKLLVDVFGHESIIDEYIDFIEKHDGVYDDSYEMHHILPRSLYNEYIKDKTNIAKLSPKNHFIAHYILAKTNNRSMLFAFNMMCNNIKYNDIDIMSDEYNDLKEAYKKEVSMIWKNKVVCKNKTGNIELVDVDEFKNGQYDAVSKGTVVAKNINDSSIKKLSIYDFNNDASYVGVTKGYVACKDVLTGDKKYVMKSEFESNINLVGFNKGRKLTADQRMKCASYSTKGKCAFTHILTNEVIYMNEDFKDEMYIKGNSNLSEKAKERFSDSKIWYNVSTKESIRSKEKPEGDKWINKRECMSNKLMVRDIVNNKNIFIDKNANVYACVPINQYLVIYNDVVYLSLDNFFNHIGMIISTKSKKKFVDMVKQPKDKYLEKNKDVFKHISFSKIKIIKAKDFIYSNEKLV